jgi:bifunctional DNase/RNase
MASSEQTSDLVQLKVHGVIADPNTDTRIVILKEGDSDNVMLPIWIGTAEGQAIEWALGDTVLQRPMSHDLIRGVAEHLEIAIKRVVVTDVRNNTYYASIYLESRGAERVIDSRPSDAIALALRTKAPIYVTQDVLKRRAGGNTELWLDRLDTKNLGKHEV